MKYLKIFATEDDYENFVQSDDFLTPNVSIVGSYSGSDDGYGNYNHNSFEVSNVHYTPATVIHGS